MARRNDHSREELRHMSIEAAEKILTEEGAAALSVRRIAKSIGYTHGTLYLLFENFDGLLFELNGRTLLELAQYLEENTRGKPAGSECLLALSQAYVRFAHINNARWRLVFEQRVPDDMPRPDLHRERIGRAHGIVAKALAAAGADRQSLKELAPAFIASIHGLTILALDRKLLDQHGDVVELEPLLERTVQLFCAALTPSTAL